MLTFVEVHRRYQDTVFEYVLQCVKSEGGALDLTQDVFIRAYRNWDATSAHTLDQIMNNLITLADAEAQQFLNSERHFTE